ncbi:MAG: hypothetical protein ABIV04_21570 [Massilia sp.]
MYSLPPPLSDPAHRIALVGQQSTTLVAPACGKLEPHRSIGKCGAGTSRAIEAAIETLRQAPTMDRSHIDVRGAAMRCYVSDNPIGLEIIVPSAYLDEFPLKEGDVVEATVEADGAVTLRKTHFDRRAFADELAFERDKMKMGTPVVEAMRDDARY